MDTTTCETGGDVDGSVADGDIAGTDGEGEVDGAAVGAVGSRVTAADGDCHGAGWDIADCAGADWDGAGVALAGGPALLVCVPQPAPKNATAHASATDALVGEILVLIAHLPT